MVQFLDNINRDDDIMLLEIIEAGTVMKYDVGIKYKYFSLRCH